MVPRSSLPAASLTICTHKDTHTYTHTTFLLLRGLDRSMYSLLFSPCTVKDKASIALHTRTYLHVLLYVFYIYMHHIHIYIYNVKEIQVGVHATERSRCSVMPELRVHVNDSIAMRSNARAQLPSLPEEHQQRGTSSSTTTTTLSLITT
ncbi:hypothetical protein HZH66_014780 [Vespula vulgaris]|uniref:Uncharacterized protein n=1 Tax=Vespula vulgaris TaxID=7454 RepID=A0A834J2L6_VESVU|nr:hypothetical protein HZH66_014780 [Vespula vulgaris]